MAGFPICQNLILSTYRFTFQAAYSLDFHFPDYKKFFSHVDVHEPLTEFPLTM